METKLYKCDQCGKASTDYYREDGWLIVEGAVSLTHGRLNHNAQTGYLDGNTIRHFCSFKCFEMYMRRINTDGSLKPKK